MSDTKVCKTCQIPKERTEFYSHSTTKDGLRPYCKPCVIEQAGDWNKQNPEKQKGYMTKCENSEKRKAYNREYYRMVANDPEKREAKNKKAREWCAKNREKIRAYQNARTKQLRDNKERVADYLIQKYGNIPCMDCEGIFAWCVMDFDHRPGETKELKIGAYSARKAIPRLIAKIEKEIAKCDLICSNCHRVRTEKRANDE